MFVQTTLYYDYKTNNLFARHHDFQFEKPTYLYVLAFKSSHDDTFLFTNLTFISF